MAFDRKTSWFVWGMALTAIPSLPLLYFLLLSLKNQPTNGLGAYAGGATEVFATVGMAVTVLLPLAAMVAFLRSLSKEHLGRSILASIATGWSALVLTYYGAMVWLIYRFQPVMGR